MQLSSWQTITNRVANRLPGPSRTLDLDRGVLSLTFDDFPRSAWRAAAPLMRQHGVRATYYLCGGYCGAVREGVPYFEPSDLTELVSEGHELGCHTFDHASAVDVTPGAYLDSVARNHRFVDGLLPGYGLRTHAFPYGHVGLRHRLALSRRFEALRGVRAPTRPDRIDRTLLRAAGLGELRVKGVDWPRLVEATVRARGWLIVFTHGVTDEPGLYDTRPEDLAGLLDLAAKAGLDFAPVGEVLSRLDRAPATAAGHVR